MGGTSIPPIALPNFESSFLSPTSQTTKGSYVPNLHNIQHPPLPMVGPSGHVGFVLVGPSSQPPTSSWVAPQQPNISSQYLSGAQ